MTDRLTLGQMLRRPASTVESRESVALLVAAVAFVVAGVIALLAFAGGPRAIAGPGSVGQFAAIGAAVTSVIVFVAARWFVGRAAPARGQDDSRLLPRMRWFDVAGVALAHGAIALLGWIGAASVMERSFIGAVLFPFSAAVLTGVVIACTAYLTVVSATSMTPTLLSLVLMVFLVVGVFASMLSATDPEWWKKNLSTLGISDDISALTFNITVIIAGLLVTTIAHFGTAGIPVRTDRERRGRAIVRGELLLLGVLLACVGLFPVDQHFAIHNSVASGMAVLFVALIIGLRRNLPTAPRVFVMLGYVMVLCIVVIAVLFATGYYNLTAVELIAFLIIFTWLVLFLRNTAAMADVPTDHLDDVEVGALR
ncbi:DUF998 domain-containing protein [Microbacterium saperdae]